MYQPINILYAAMATVFLYHGLTKKLTGFAKHFRLPLLIAAAVIFAEVSAGIGYLVNIFYHHRFGGLMPAQWASIAIIPVLLGAIYMVHRKNGFNVMNNGYEYQMTLLAVALYILWKN